jgi:hypothetical protein
MSGQQKSSSGTKEITAIIMMMIMPALDRAFILTQISS